MKVWHLLGALVMALALALVASCGDTVSDDDSGPRNEAFTPIPTATAVPKLCGNGCVDEAVGEECDLGNAPEPPMCSVGEEACAAQPNGGCPTGESCVCCICLGDDETLGERVLDLARPASKFLSTGLAGSDVSNDPWLMGPLVLRAGRPTPCDPPTAEFPDDNCTTPPSDPLAGDPECSASLELADDALIGFNDPIQGTFCAKLFAASSVGFIDCDGGTGHAVTMSIDSMGAADEGPTTFCRNQGDPVGGPGAATLRIDNAVIFRVPLGTAPGSTARPASELCPLLNYDDPFNADQIAEYNISPSDILVAPLVLSTQTSAGQVLNPSGSATVLLPPVPGENFVCSRFSETDGPGGLVGNVAGLDNPLAGGDTLNAFLIFDRNPPPATPTPAP